MYLEIQTRQIDSDGECMDLAGRGVFTDGPDTEGEEVEVCQVPYFLGKWGLQASITSVLDISGTVQRVVVGADVGYGGRREPGRGGTGIGQETGDRRQETGDRRQETGDRRQEKENMAQMAQSEFTYPPPNKRTREDHESRYSQIMRTLDEAENPTAQLNYIRKSVMLILEVLWLIALTLLDIRDQSRGTSGGNVLPPGQPHGGQGGMVGTGVQGSQGWGKRR